MGFDFSFDAGETPPPSNFDLIHPSWYACLLYISDAADE